MALGQEEIGRLIKEAREDAGLTQPALAERIGLKHPQSISRYERGIGEIPQRRLRQIAEATDKPLSFFLGELPTREEELGGDVAPMVREVLERVRAIQAGQGEIEQRLGRLEAAEARRGRQPAAGE